MTVMLGKRSARFSGQADRLPTPHSLHVPFRGGMDTETPPLQLKPGACREALNYEIGPEGGYVDTDGYERFDGKAAPSDGSYSVLPATLTGTVAVGDTVTGGTSSATGKVLAVVDGYLVITAVSGTWQTAEDIEVSSVVVGVTTGIAADRGGATTLLDATYLSLAADYYRALIAAVPGEGQIRGGWYFNGVCYAVRNAVGGASAKLYKSTGSGWSEVALGRSLAFTSGGTYVMAVGNTITGATSGATAVLTGVEIRSGSFAGGDAEGVLTFASQTGTFLSENLNVGANPNVATIAGNSSAIALTAGGRYQTVVHKFEDVSSERVYGVSGVAAAFSFDGTTYIPISRTGTNTPAHIAVINQHLLLSLPTGRLNGSAQGNPYSDEVISGAWEKSVGAEITGLALEPGNDTAGAVLVTSRNRAWMLYGHDKDDFQLVQFRESVGAYPYTIAQVATTLFLDDTGVINYRAVQDYGNFLHSSITQHIRSWLNPRRRYAVAACPVRDRNQYRLYFSDGTGLCITFSGSKPLGCMPLWYPHSALVTWCGEDANGDEVIFFGSDDGYVRQMNKGTSFDGESIDAHIELHPIRPQGPEIVCSFHNFIIESRGETYSAWDVLHRLDYGSPDRLQPEAPINAVSTLTPAVAWDSGSLFWDVASLTWDGVAAQPSSSIRIRGSGENLILVLSRTGTLGKPVRHSGGMLRYTTRRLRT